MATGRTHDPVRVVHVITDLNVGGAELALHALLTRLDPRLFPSRVISLKSAGDVAHKIAQLGVPVHVAGLSGDPTDGAALVRLIGLVRTCHPDIVQTWMYHADLLGSLAARFAGRPHVVWGIRQASLDPFQRKWTLRWIARASAGMSHRVPSAIVSGSEAGMRLHAALGYDRDKMIVIPNGIDTDRFAPSPEARAEVRNELGVGAATPLIGMFGRFDPDKDHATFIGMAALLARDPEVRFLLAGPGVQDTNPSLREMMSQPHLDRRIHLLGLRLDVERVMAALDLGVSSSSAEGFPNSVAEMMACGIPCAVTDVGDSKLIVADTGEVVPARDPEGLAAACRRLLDLEVEQRIGLGLRARRRIQQHFDVAVMADRYAKVYLGLMQGASPCAA